MEALALLSPAFIGAEQIEPLSSVLPGFSAAPQLSLLAPAGIVQALLEAPRRTLQMPDLVQAAAQQGAVPA